MSKQKGFSLVEVIISVMVIGIVMYAVIAIFITSGMKGANVETFTVAQSLAEGKLEEVMAAEFSNVSAQSLTSFSGNLNEYSYEVIVDFVTGEALDIPVAVPTPYKKITVNVYNDKLANPVGLESIKAEF